VFRVLTLSVGVVLLLSLTLLVRRQRRPRVVPKVLDKSGASARLSADADAYTVEYGMTPGANPDPALPLAAADVGPDTDDASTVSLPAGGTIDLGDLALASPVAKTNSVDLDVGTPVATGARVDWFTDESEENTVEDDTLNAATTRMADVGAELADHQQPAKASGVSLPAVNDEQMTMTIAEVDLLRQDYEAEHTLTQQLSQELRVAVADLEATKTARAAAGESASSEALHGPRAEAPDPRADSKAAPSRGKQRTRTARN
jgi:hypothetical protein